jgi:hypothetical protein
MKQKSSDINGMTNFYSQFLGKDYIIRCVNYMGMGVAEPLLHVGAEIIEVSPDGSQALLGVINKECWIFATDNIKGGKDTSLFFGHIIDFLKSDRYLFSF